MFLAIKSTWFLMLLITSSTVHCFDNDCTTSSNESRPLRLSVANIPPLSTVTKLLNGTYIYGGSGFLLAKWLAEKLERPLVIIVPKEEDITKLGYLKATLNQAIKKEVDLSTLSFVPTLELMKYLEFSYPVFMESFRMIVPATEGQIRLFPFLQPFQPMVWCWLVLSLIALIIITSLTTWFDTNSKRIRQSNMKPAANRRRRTRPMKAISDEFALKPKSFEYYLNRAVFYTLNTTFNNKGAVRSPFKRTTLRIAGGIWLLSITVLIYSYSSLLTSSLTVPQSKPPIETLEDVANSKEFTLYLNPDTELGKAVMEASSGVWKTLGDQLRRRPEGLYKHILNSSSVPFTNPGYATPLISPYATWAIKRLYKEDQICRFHLTRPIPFSPHFSFILPKGGEDNHKINKAIMALWETGLSNIWKKRDFDVPGVDDKCLAKKSESTDTKNATQLKLVNYKGAFTTLGIGWGLATLCFLLELIVAKYKREMTI